MGFWDKLPKPFFAMAPMADVTDAAFRALVAKRGKPDIFWTEFVSADGLHATLTGGAEARGSQKPGFGERFASLLLAEQPKLNFGNSYRSLTSVNPFLRDLQFSEVEHPIVAQLFSSRPDRIAYAAKLAEELGFDGVDLNMGCPDRSIERQGAGAALIKNPAHAVSLIRAAQAATALPVSVKTRVGYTRESLEEPASTRGDSTRSGWLTALLEAGPAAITLHLRTRKEMSAVPADWGLMRKAVEIRNQVNPNVLLIGNGDIRDLEDARTKVAEAGCEGAMLGRAMFGNPWVFEGLRGLRKSSADYGLTKSIHGLEEKLAALVELAYNFEKLSPPKHFDILKKHIKAFVIGFSGAAELRAKLMQANSAAELEALITEHTSSLVPSA